MSVLAISAYELVVPLIPSSCPVIIESVVPADRIEDERGKNAGLFSVSTLPHATVEAARAFG